MSDQSSPTYKSKAQVEAVYWDMYWDVNGGTTEATIEECALRESSWWSPKRTSKNDCLVLMTTGCKIYSIEHGDALHWAQTALAHLNLVKHNHLWKVYMLDVNEWDIAYTDASHVND